MSSHQTYFLQALEQAKKGQGVCAPNPAVGAVIVYKDKVIARGYHRGSGRPHAEVEAIKNSNKQYLKESILYITLEPCCHWGKTPPCTDAIIAAGIKRVFYAFKDPNPKMAGKGAAKLKKAGITCKRVNVPDINEFYQSYQHWWQTGLPFVTAKIALSLDGKIAGEGGKPVTITGEALKQFTHQQRKNSDAILTTAKTIKNDNPQLNVRLKNKTISKSIYILDSQLSLPLNSQIFKTAKNITVFHQTKIDKKQLQKLTAKKINCIAVPNNKNGLDLKAILKHIGNVGVHDLWVEAGGQCFQSFIANNLAQKAFVYIAPKILGANATAAFADHFDVLRTTKELKWQQVGQDILAEITI